MTVPAFLRYQNFAMMSLILSKKLDTEVTTFFDKIKDIIAKF